MVLETLDRFDLITRIIPEWEPVRSRPQRNAFHQFTVDRHLMEAAAQASALTRRVDRPDLLLVGAFFHDLGKGYPRRSHRRRRARSWTRSPPGWDSSPTTSRC